MVKFPKILPCTVFLLFLQSGISYSQGYRLELSENPLNLKFPGKSDSSGVLRSLDRVRNLYLANSYLEFSVDSISWKNGLALASVHTGKKYTFKSVRITLDSQSNPFQGIANRYTGSDLDSSSLAAAAEEMLRLLEDNGYPFSRITVSTKYLNGGLHAVYHIEKGSYFVFDTCHIDGDQVIKKSFLEAYTGIKRGTPYNEALFRKAHEKLNQLPFLVSERIPQIVFIHGGVSRPYYYLKRKKSDQVNGIIGLAPSGVSGENVTLTGEFTLKLNNLFRSAKVLHINWRSFRARSQELKAYFSYPYLFSKPVGVDAGMELLKFDTLYTVFQRQLGLQYFTSGISGVKIFYRVSGTNLNSVDTAQIRSTARFPAVNAIETRQYGIMFNFSGLDYRFNPRKGYITEGSVSVGSKEILKDNQIESIRFGPEKSSLYDSAELRSTQYQYNFRLDKYFPLASRSTFRVGISASSIIAPVVYFNELIREGGVNSLKGFNEQSIFADNFNMLELEYRYLIGLNSHIRIFWNGAYYEDKSYGRQNAVYDTPWGFGLGGNIETGAGILTLIYALGKEKSNPFDIRTGKFHFGISSYF